MRNNRLAPRYSQDEVLSIQRRAKELGLAVESFCRMAVLKEVNSQNG